MEAPETIYADIHKGGLNGLVHDDLEKFKQCTELPIERYIRADIHDAVVRERDELKDQVFDLSQWESRGKYLEERMSVVREDAVSRFNRIKKYRQEATTLRTQVERLRELLQEILNKDTEALRKLEAMGFPGVQTPELTEKVRAALASRVEGENGYIEPTDTMLDFWWNGPYAPGPGLPAFEDGFRKGHKAGYMQAMGFNGEPTPPQATAEEGKYATSKEWFASRAGAEEGLEITAGAPPQCTLPPAGWRCTRKPGHDGPCAAVPMPTAEESSVVQLARQVEAAYQAGVAKRDGEWEEFRGDGVTLEQVGDQARQLDGWVTITAPQRSLQGHIYRRRTSTN